MKTRLSECCSLNTGFGIYFGSKPRPVLMPTIMDFYWTMPVRAH